MRVALAGFGPFPGAPVNPSGLLVRELARRRRPAFAGIALSAHVFATSYAAVDRDLPKLLAGRPDIVLIFGLAARRRHVCVETLARNAASLVIPDAGGQKPIQGEIEFGGPVALRGRAPFAHLVHALQQSAVPARLSNDAGRYLCNYVYWRALRRARGGRPLVQFVHIPGALSLRRLIPAAEALLIALIAASRR